MYSLPPTLDAAYPRTLFRSTDVAVSVRGKTKEAEVSHVNHSIEAGVLPSTTFATVSGKERMVRFPQ
jgi:hypothetical protein